MESKRKYFVLILFLLLALMIFAFANPIVEESTDFTDNNKGTEEVEKPEVIIDTEKEDEDINYIPVVRPVQKEETTEDKKEEVKEEIDTTYEEALAAVEYAEATYKTEDVKKAKELVNKVTDTTKKGELEDRLAEVEAGIEVMELIEELEYQVGKATEREDIVSAKDYRDENEVAKKLDALTNEDVKEALQERLDKVNKYLDDETAPKVNINDKYVFTEDVEIIVEDENDVTITLTKDGEELEDTSKTSGDGIYTLTVVDKAFNETKVTFIVDGTNPVFKGLTNGKHYDEFEVNVEDTSKVTIMISKDGETEVAIENNTTVTEEGTYKITATDEAGNTTTIWVAIDKTAPTIDRTSEVEYPTADQTVIVKDKFLTNVTVEGPEQEGTYTREDFTVGERNENFAIEFTFTTEGTYTITATDKIGLTTTETFTIDKTAPVINGFEKYKYWYNTNIKPELVETNIESYTLNGEEYDGKEITEDGHYVLIAKDKAGFTTTVKFAIDQTAPTITEVENNKFYNITVKPVIEDENLAYVTINKLPYIPGTPIFLYGKYELVAYDKAGNSTKVNFTIDNIKPKILLLDRIEYISGKYLPIKPVILEQYIDTIVVKKNGVVIPYEKGQQLTDDATYEITVTDKAGNTETVTFTMDSVSPTAMVKPAQLGVVSQLDLNNLEVVDSLDDLNLALLNKDILLTEDAEFFLFKKSKDINVLDKNIPIYKPVKMPEDKIIDEEGQYYLVAYDKAYNVTAIAFTVDRTAPIINGLEEGKVYYNKPVTITVTEANPYLNIIGQDATVTVSKTGTLFPTLKTYKANEAFTLSEDGEYTIKAKDIAKNETKEIKFIIDQTPATISVKFDGENEAKSYEEVQESNTNLNITATVTDANPSSESNVIIPIVYIYDEIEEKYRKLDSSASTLPINYSGTQYKLVYTYTDAAGNTATKEIEVKVVNISYSVKFDAESYTGTFNGNKHSVPEKATFYMTKDTVTTKVENAEIVYTANADMVNVGKYTITATVDGKYTATATYEIVKAEVNVVFNDDKTVSVTFEDGNDASDYVTFKYYAWGKKQSSLFGRPIEVPAIVEVTQPPVDKEYYVTVSANENVTIAGAADIDLTRLIDGLRINGKYHKYN